MPFLPLDPVEISPGSAPGPSGRGRIFAGQPAPQPPAVRGTPAKDQPCTGCFLCRNRSLRRDQKVWVMGSRPEAQVDLPGSWPLYAGTAAQNTRKEGTIIVRRQRGFAVGFFQGEQSSARRRVQGVLAREVDTEVSSPFFRSTPLPVPKTPMGCPAILHTRCSGYR